MEAEQEDDTEDDRGKENLSDAVVENLLVGVRGVTEAGFLLSRRFNGDDGTGGCVLFYVHVLDSLGCSAEISLRSQRCSWGVPPVSGARVFITKVPVYYNNFFCKILQGYF